MATPREITARLQIYARFVNQMQELMEAKVRWVSSIIDWENPPNDLWEKYSRILTLLDADKPDEVFNHEWFECMLRGSINKLFAEFDKLDKLTDELVKLRDKKSKRVYPL